MPIEVLPVFKTEVPEPFVAKRVLVQKWCEEVLDNVGNFEDVYNTRSDEVENESRDGFIPYTDGGFEGVAYATLGYADGAGCAPAIIQPYIDAEHKAAQEAWDEGHPERTYETIFAETVEEAGQTPLPGFKPSMEAEHARDEYYQFEHDYMSEGGTYFYKVRAIFFDTDNRRNESGKPEVYFMVGINTDFEYGRDSIPWLSCYGGNPVQTTWPWEKTVPIEDITEELVATMVEEATAALRNL